jgi:flagellar protein FliO/FliZ
MFETLFGSGVPLAARFFIAFLVVLGLIGATAWLVRRFGANRLGGGGARGRQPRLAVIDATTVDGRRRLVLIRRDNIEHLLMIGGPTDVVVEANIVRAAAAREATREPARAGIAPEIQPRPTPVVENGWPLQPLSEPAPVAPPRPYRASATEEPWLAPEPGARPRPAENLKTVAHEPLTHITPDLATPAPRSAPPAPRVSAAPPVAPESAAQPQADQNLAEMAQQLEAALRRTPMPEGRPPVSDAQAAQVTAPHTKPAEAPARAPLREYKPRVELKFEPRPQAKFEPKVEPRPEAKLETKPEPKSEPKPELIPETKSEPTLEAKAEPKPEAKPEVKPEPAAAPSKSRYDDLEEEMASLLGRPSGKS